MEISHPLLYKETCSQGIKSITCVSSPSAVLWCSHWLHGSQSLRIKKKRKTQHFLKATAPLQCDWLKVGQMRWAAAFPGFFLNLFNFFKVGLPESFLNFRCSWSGSELRSLSYSVKAVIHSLHLSSTVELITGVIKKLIQRAVSASHYMTDQLCEM